MTTPHKEIASGLKFPEGPVAMPDGSVILVEIARQTLTRIMPDGKQHVVAKLGGGPNGAAMGPNGKMFVTNNGGFNWIERPDGRLFPGTQPTDYKGGSIQVVDPETGKFETLYDSCDGRKLNGPNDLVFDNAGGFWFTDLGKRRPFDWDRGVVFYAHPDGSLIRAAIHPMVTPNGIGISPEGDRLYIAESETARLWAFELTGPGEIRKTLGLAPHGGSIVAGLPGYCGFDSLAVEAGGAIAVTTTITSRITVFAPDGGIIEEIPMPDLFPTNIAFGGEDMRTAFITLGSSGRLVTMRWARPGLKLNFG